MDIEHIKMLKAETEAEILSILKKFEAITCTSVAGIKHNCCITVGEPIRTANVELVVYIP